PYRGSLRAGNRGSLREVKEVLPVAASALGLTLQPWEVRAADDFDRIFGALNKQAGLGGVVVGGARSVPDRAARSKSERAAPSACVGKRFSALRLSGINRLAAPGARGGARVGRPR